jgi:two-component system, cell cycle response regulator CtrA
MRVLIASNDLLRAAGIKAILAQQNWICDTMALGEECLWLARTAGYRIILLDMTLSGVRGYRFAERLRTAETSAPILILSDLATGDRSLRNLGFAAEQCLRAPFSFSQLFARIQKVVQRRAEEGPSVVRPGELVVQLDSGIVSVDGREVNLTAKEYAVLELLSRRKGTIVTTEMLLDHLYRGRNKPERQIIGVFIHTLRKKLATTPGGELYIENIRGRGYRLRNPGHIPPLNN